MSSCGANCGCGSDCKCGSGCKCGMYPDLEVQTAAHATIVTGVAPNKTYAEGSEMSFGAEGGHACKCGKSCTCNPCKCGNSCNC
ncbi:metallothionein-like protein 1 [Cornus florida]|uniref:metallothionein-like protein 1 n=1 Tax=Cornus florida TaxID=4283 RepID=UPI0028999AFA|nr:metallothionein-like protein 1 [Cornus florida]